MAVDFQSLEETALLLPALNFLLDEHELASGLAGNGGILLRTADEVGDNILYGSVGQVFRGMETMRGKIESDVIAHAV